MYYLRQRLLVLKDLEKIFYENIEDIIEEMKSLSQSEAELLQFYRKEIYTIRKLIEKNTRETKKIENQLEGFLFLD